MNVRQFLNRMAAALALLAVPASHAADAATLARYDTNKNGQLDPDELKAMEADMKRAGSTEANNKPDETITLSPFEVVGDTRGYFSANTMSGTRLNSKLEDLGSAISVITKEQMADFAMLDINDIFLYAPNVEGTGTFTDIIEDTSQGMVADNTARDPANANRVRGIGNANVSNGNFETSGRVPIDPIDADGVEISRGPNANIFGLGNASGTINIVSAAANVRRNRSTVAFRADSFEGYRASIDLNRVLKKDALAVRVNAVRQRDGFNLKPSGVYTERYNGMVQFRPFNKTLINASYQYYRAHGNRPNSFPPLDGLTTWRNAGSPTWDPVTGERKLNGVVVATTPAGSYMYGSNQFAKLFIDRDGVKYMSSTFGVSGNTPLSGILTNRNLVVTRAGVADAQPLIGRRVRHLIDKSIYDWSSININAANRFEDKTETTKITVDQVFLESRRQSLAAQVGWFREDSEKYFRFYMADQPVGIVSGQFVMDINERLLDGSPNPFFMRPLMSQGTPRSRSMPLRSDIYRGQFAYKLDFTSDNGLRRWLGAHALAGYAEYKERVQRAYHYFIGIVNDPPWLLDASGNSLRSNAASKIWGLFYVGDNQGGNADYAPAPPTFGPYTYVWGNPNTGEFNRDSVVLGEFPASSSGSRTLQKTRGAILQSRLLQGRIVSTFGVREDDHYTKFQNPTQITSDLLGFDFQSMNHWAPVDWQRRDGRTEQRGVVVKPFRGFAGIERRAQQGTRVTRFLANALSGASLHYNRSDSFLPSPPVQNVFLQWLPDPGGKGKDYGFSLNLFDGKLGVRVNKYETWQINSRSGASARFARAMLNIDFLDSGDSLQNKATEWITEMAEARGQTLTKAELDAELEKVMGVPPRDYEEIRANPQSETDDIVSRGHEVEIHYNPNRFWTVSAGLTEKRTINTRLSPNVTLYAASRMPYWTTAVDPRTNTLWWNTLYGGAETRAQFYRRVIGNPHKVAQATEGLSRPQIRRYGARISTNFRLAGLTEQSFLKRLSIGGAMRYESRGGIGYWGVQQRPAIIDEYDITRPIWDKAHVYLDALVGYRTRLFSDKVGATFQLNVRNLQENGRLQPINAFPDGEPYQFRIVSPRQFILSATFDL